MTVTEEARALLDAVDDLARKVGNFLVARGLVAEWRDLYTLLARGGRRRGSPWGRTTRPRGFRRTRT